ncbi:anti-sigma-I factor RsgI family protein [Ectobacillus funiculus]|uniref:Anti-sigma factor domain-containing protein n=1 Tax=Ectobacillus funiculus TaxID=137993 RepID=A0ABV5WMV4_9BACI
MNRGIVMEVQKQSVLVLTSEGEFVKCKRQHREYEIGEEILFPQAERIQQRSKLLFFFWPKRLAFATSSVLAACLWLFFNSPAEEKAMAYVAVDINPSLEISVDSEMHVLKLEAYNEDGQRVLSKLKAGEGESLSKVIHAIVRQSQQDGYLKADKPVTITSVAASGADKQIEKRIDDIVTTVQKTYEKESVTVVCQKGTMQVREDAKRAGVSTGIYMKQEKERLQQKQEENRKLEQTPTPQQETPKSQPVQQSEEKQKEVPLAPSNNANTVPPQQREIEQETEKAVDKGQQKKENKQDKQENVSTATKKKNGGDKEEKQNNDKQDDHKQNEHRQDNDGQDNHKQNKHD